MLSPCEDADPRAFTIWLSFLSRSMVERDLAEMIPVRCIQSGQETKKKRERCGLLFFSRRKFIIIMSIILNPAKQRKETHPLLIYEFPSVTKVLWNDLILETFQLHGNSNECGYSLNYTPHTPENDDNCFAPDIPAVLPARPHFHQELP